MVSDSSVYEKLKKVDWSFSSLGNSGIHSLHWYPATYIGAIPGTLIPILSGKNDIVLDPFCGSGTTGVESIRLQREFIGIDNNPISKLITHMKLFTPDTKNLQNHIVQISEKSLLLPSLYFENKKHKQEDELLDWYHPDTYIELCAILGAILTIKSRDMQHCLLGLFSSILKNASSQGKHWGWVCDNVKPKNDEISYKDARSIFSDAASKYISSINSYYQSARAESGGITRAKMREKVEILSGNCITHMKNIDDSSIGLIMTSPPYFGVADYIKSQRLSYLWFDLDELNSIGAQFRHFNDLREEEAGARSKRHRSTSFLDYIDFMSSFFSEAYRVTKDGKYMALIVGESRSREQTTEHLINSAEKAGFSLFFRGQRDIKATRRRMMAKVQNEEVLVFEK